MSVLMLWTAPPPGTRVPSSTARGIYSSVSRRRSSMPSAHLAEFGMLRRSPADPNDKRVPDKARACLAALGAQLRRIKQQILEFDRMIRAWHRSNEISTRLDDCPGAGPALATTLVASVADPMVFKSGRNFSAWIGR